MWKSKISNWSCKTLPQSKQSFEFTIMFQGNSAASWLSKVQFDVDPTMLVFGSLCTKSQEQKIQSRQKEQMKEDMQLLLPQTPSVQLRPLTVLH